jgi:LmbE family N-acetylglucosaminyl deacetylase
VLTLTFGDQETRLSRVLVIGAHADDIEIGCGGTILRLVQSHPDLEWCWVVLSGEGERGREALASASEFIPQAERQRVIVKTFRDGFLPYSGGAVKDFFEELAPTVSPDLILTHWRHDLHQDHRLAAELTWNTFRDHLILEYEIPKYDGEAGVPNVFVHLTREVSRQKVEAIVRNFPSQQSHAWFDRELFLGLLRLRGMQSRAEEGYAEAFYGAKLVF